MFAVTWLKSPITSSGTEPLRTGTSARIVSIASFVCTSRSEILTRLSSSSSCLISSSLGSLANALSRLDLLGGEPHLLGVDLLQRRTAFVARDLALGGVRSRHGQERGGAELLGHWERPFDQILDGGPRRAHVTGGEVDQLAGEAVADRAPEVLLDQAMRIRGQRLALVDRPHDPGGERVHQRAQRARLLEVGLAVADPDLDGRKREVGPHAPPDLGVLVDGARVVEEADEALVLLPADELVGNAAAGERPGEDLRPRGVEVGVDVLHERRAGREREQLRQEVAKRVVDRDHAVEAADADVDVDAEAVVAPDDVAEDLVISPVVGRVDDPLVLPGAPRMGG